MNQKWFEMDDIRCRKLKKRIWIPLRAVQKLQSEGKYGYTGYREEFFGAGSIAIPVEHKADAEKLGWKDIGIIHQQSGYCQSGKYIPAEVYEHYSDRLTSIWLVLEQRTNRSEVIQWHLNQDFVITLGLKRENDIWLSPDEGYIEVARLHRDPNGNPSLLEVRAEHLKDYLCARNMGLYVTSYFSRDAIVDDASFILWKDKASRGESENEVWEGRIIEIHEGGHPFGEKIAVFHISRTDVDKSEDIPDISGIPTDENTTFSSWERNFDGRKLYRITGEFWRNEWLDPAKISPRVKEDESPPTVFFIVDEEGNKESKKTLEGGGKWLWFKPNVIMALTHRRGGALDWYTRDTGNVRCSPNYDVHFGVNKLGLVNVYAKDMALLPEWQQQIWAGYNVAPEGGVSEELLASQVKADPANTQAPEKFLKCGIETANSFAREKLKISLFMNHELIPKLVERTHRFRAVDDSGLYALAKDITRLIADSLDTAAMQSIVPPPKNTEWGSLKSLENLLASKINREAARSITAAFVGAYDLRLRDAHLPEKDITNAFALLNIDRSLPTIIQGYQLLNSCVSSIYAVADVIKKWDEL